MAAHRLLVGTLISLILLGGALPVQAQLTAYEFGLGGDWAYADALNNHGAVVGNGTTPSEESFLFLWTAEEGIQKFGGEGLGTAADINDSQQVVGLLNSRAFLWTAAEGMQDLGTLGGSGSAAWSINEQGHIVGSADLADGIGRHAFLWTAAEGMQDLGTLGGERSGATAINENNVVVGWSELANGTTHAFMWTAAEGMQDLGALGGPGTFSQAEDINDHGQVVGHGTIIDPQDGEVYRRAFLWTAEKGMQDLGTLSGLDSWAYAINDRGQIVGADGGFHPRPHAVLWTTGPQAATHPVPAQYIDTTTWYSYAHDINDRGQVAGYRGFDLFSTAVLWSNPPKGR